ncbi:MAG: MBL fold metallo-hydrolase [Pseudomonadota bacterium]
MRNSLATCATLIAGFALGASAEAATCLKVTLTGTQGGPPLFRGQAGAGTLVQYGDEENDCGDVRMQFDTGRGTNQQLSKIGVPVGTLDAIFFTHMHSDHTEGLHDIMQLRWHFVSGGPKVDIVCSNDAKAPTPLVYTLSCRNFVTHIGDEFIQSGEIAQRLAENKNRLPGGPADLANVMTFEPGREPAEVWSSGDVTVSAIGSTHIPGHASYRVDTPAGSVVIGGDAGNDIRQPPRPSSTSEQVELLAEGADVLVHSTIHPVMGPDGESGFPPPIYYRQSTASDLGALSQRAGVENLMLTHLIPPLGAARQGPYPIAGGGLSEADYLQAVQDAGYAGNTIVGTDLAELTLVMP